MVNLVEYLGIPGTIAMAIIALYLTMQLVGEFVELCGKVVPEFFKILLHLGAGHAPYPCRWYNRRDDPGQDSGLSPRHGWHTPHNYGTVPGKASRFP